MMLNKDKLYELEMGDDKMKLRYLSFVSMVALILIISAQNSWAQDNAVSGAKPIDWPDTFAAHFAKAFFMVST